MSEKYALNLRYKVIVMFCITRHENWGNRYDIGIGLEKLGQPKKNNKKTKSRKNPMSFEKTLR